jgi:aminoglycoside phosphotransferase (APT) family kinase protein
VKLLAQGRASEIFALDDGRVLRRFKAGGDPGREASVMKRALAHGYPVPRVLEVLADGLVLERIEGPTMADDGRRRPWRIDAYARRLARLHDDLHRIPGEEGGVLLHLDLHPKNVLVSAEGPVVIDWANARDGPAELDPALTWVIMMTSAGMLGRLFARTFAHHIDVRAGLEEAAAFRIRDRNVSAGEREAVERLVARAARQYD